MEKALRFSLLLLLLIPVLASCVEKQVYIVYFGEHSGEKTQHEIEENHHSYLSSVKESEEDARSSLLYSYKHSINGFAALLTLEEAEKLSGKEETVSVFKSKEYSLHTTRSWEFAGVEKLLNEFNSDDKDDLLVKAKFGRDVIVGMLDSGVWPESHSFKDKGSGPVPKRWKGICQTGDQFNTSNCNRKIIGARYYIKGYEKYYGPLNRTLDYRSPRDKDGHGTHTASTVGGRRVHNVAALGGFAHGTASGGAPLVRLAIYKVCWPMPKAGKEEGNTCFDADMLAGIDDAIKDGVDVLSISIGAYDATPFSQDSIAIGALHAVKNNIITACSAGNSGPAPYTIRNTAPWILTVSASSLDRKFVAAVELGNGEKLQGESISPYHLKRKLYPLVRAGQVVNPNVTKDLLDQCMPGSLSPGKAKGKIVLCLRGNGTRVGKGAEVKRAGGVGYILGNNKKLGEDVSVDCHLLPSNAVGYRNAVKILKYINSTKNATAFITPAKTIIHDIPAPHMASFTSVGPSPVSEAILKPDITAPGLNILAAWSEGDSPTKMDVDHRVVKYNFLSGTSMSCPHIAGAAALLRAIHPTWSSAAIRSALMTTAGILNNMGKPITDAAGNEANSFLFGSGHFRPSMAADPGLVYDASYEDYLLHLCSIGYDLKNLTHNGSCPKNLPPPHNLNYPSVAIPKLNGTVVVKRTVTHVGSSKSIYFSSVKPPVGISVTISPPILNLNQYGEKKSFTIRVRADNTEGVGEIAKQKYRFGWYIWRDGNGTHSVRSPIAVAFS